jgi:hypothetical protein
LTSATEFLGSAAVKLPLPFAAAAAEMEAFAGTADTSIMDQLFGEDEGVLEAIQNTIENILTTSTART